MNYHGPERREHRRIKASFVVSYRPLEEHEYADLSQTKNFSQGGMLLTTNVKFSANTFLKMYIRVPNVREKINLIGRVVDSKEVVKNLIYETRIGFQDLDEKIASLLGDTVKGFGQGECRKDE